VGRGAGLGRFAKEKKYHALAAGKKSIIDDACHIVIWFFYLLNPPHAPLQ